MQGIQPEWACHAPSTAAGPVRGPARTIRTTITTIVTAATITVTAIEATAPTTTMTTAPTAFGPIESSPAAWWVLEHQDHQAEQEAGDGDGHGERADARAAVAG